MSLTPSPVPAPPAPTASTPERYLIAFVIQGEDVFKITADNIVHTTGTAGGPAFDAIAKLKAAAALLELTNRHKERPDELRQMARELANEGMKLMARASSAIQPVSPPETPEEVVATAPAGEAAEESSFEQLRSEQPRYEQLRQALTVAAGEEAVPEPAVVPIRPPVDTKTNPSNTPPLNSKIALISG